MIKRKKISIFSFKGSCWLVQSFITKEIYTNIKIYISNIKIYILKLYHQLISKIYKADNCLKTPTCQV